MKTRSFFNLLMVSVVVISVPAACSNDSGVRGGDGDGDNQGGAAGDGDINPGDGDIGSPYPTDPPSCDGLGTACDDADSCCSGYCNSGAGGSGSCGCSPEGSDCRVGQDCCSGQCNPLTYECVQVPGACSQAGTPCSNGTECCTLSCVDDFCSEDACVQDTQECSQNGECCSGKCDGGTCATINTGGGYNCATAGNSCENDGSCCSGLCNDEGTCSIGSSYCVQRGDVCSSNSQCCQGVCAIADGDSSGYCTTQDTGGTRCGNRLIAGEVCSGDCSECCSRTCAPYGPSGKTICQPPTGCRTDGELCRSALDCCGGNPDSTIPGAGQAECLKLSPDDLVGRCKVGGCNPHGAICGSPDSGTAACSGSLSAPNGEKCCGSNMLDKDVNPCSVDSLLIPRCDVLEGCVEPEGECATADDCCNGNPCVQNELGIFSCYDTTDSCVPSGGPCTATADCCRGSLCILEPGQATGVCGNDDPPGGTGGGSSGTGGGSTACAEYGQDCTTSDDCCSDVPCDSQSGTCRYPAVR